MELKLSGKPAILYADGTYRKHVLDEENNMVFTAVGHTQQEAQRRAEDLVFAWTVTAANVLENRNEAMEEENTKTDNKNIGWEYNVWWWYGDMLHRKDVTAHLTEYGNKGWELIEVKRVYRGWLIKRYIRTEWYFKRLKK